MWFKNLVLFGILVCITVIGCKAQVRVEVTFDPPSPVEQGNVTFKCDFTLPDGTVLDEQYWQIVNGDRFFEYVPGGNLSIHADYTDKIFGYDTDNTTYLEIYFNVTACDVEQYLCNILANSSADNNKQESLEVKNMIAPVLKYGDEIISENRTIVPVSNQTVSCSLGDAGPPLPELLQLEISYVETDPESDDHEQTDETCTWSYPNHLGFFVDVNDFNDTATFQCRVNYTDHAPRYSPLLTLTSDPTTTQVQTTTPTTTLLPGQIPVTVIFDPPSPVERGSVTFRCEFTLPAGTALIQQYWKTVTGIRIFNYYPGSDPSIDPDYQDKIFGYQTDDTTYLELYFNVTACDTEYYTCHVLANSGAENDEQESLQVENMIAPVLKYGDEIISGDTTIIHANSETVSCSLDDAGPPIPELLWFTISYVNPNLETDQHEQSAETCTWSYPNPLDFFVDVNDLPSTAYFQCWVDYTGRDSMYSPVLTLTTSGFHLHKTSNYLEN